MAEQSVGQIVQRCQQGDREAFGQLYILMSDRMRKVCLRYVNDENTVNDLLHDSFVLIFSKINTLNNPSKAEPWMLKIAHNLSVTYLQQSQQQPVVSLDALEEPLTVASPETMPITYDEILNLVDTLPNSYQQVFRLSVLEGLSHQEIAALLNIEPHTSSAELFRAKKMLRQSLAFLLLGLLCIALPLGWYWMHVKSVDAGPKEAHAVGANVPRESTGRPDAVQSLSDEPSERLGRIVRTPRTNVGRPLLTDTLPLLPKENVEKDETDSVSEPQQPAIRPSRQPALQPEMPVPARNRQQEWSVQLAYSGIHNDRSFNLPYGEKDMNDPVMDTITHHRMPLTISLLVDKMLNRHLSIGTGLQFTQLYSETQEGNTYSRIQKEQRLRYLGIPLRLSWHPVRTNRWSLYGTAQTMLELPLRSTLERSTIIDGHQIESEQLLLGPSVQWSLGIGAGLEYRLTPVIGIYVEPSLQYHFKTGDGLDSYRTVHPVNLSIPLGVRITFK